MVSIITVNYNGYKDTLELVESFRQFEDYPHEFIVVDNASPNGDGERLERALGDTTRTSGSPGRTIWGTGRQREITSYTSITI